MQRIESYILKIKSGEIIAGRLIKLAVDRHLRDLESKDFYFDTETVQQVLDFCEICRHWKGTKAGERLILEEWQCFYIGSIFGWKLNNGRRRFRRTFMEVARKNAKTTMLALINLYHLMIENESGSQVYCAATKEDQARILVNDTGKIIESTPELRKRFKLFKYKDLITRVSYSATNSFVAALGRDSRTHDGFDPTMGNIDEFHEHPTTEILNVIVSGMGARPQPLLNVITTAGFNKEYPCYLVTRKTGIEILEGAKKDESSLVLIYEMDNGDEWDDKKNWIKANPNIGVSVEPTFLDSEFITAQNEGSRTEVNFKTKHLNMWVDAPDVWIPDERWMRCNGVAPNLNGATVYAGLDLAKTLDLNAFVLLFTDFDPMIVKAYFWLPEDTLNQADKDNYNQWVKEGLITVIPGSIARGNIIAKDILEIIKPYNIKSIAYDPYIATHECVPILDDAGLVLSPLVQRFSDLSPPTKKLEELVYSKRINHLNDSVLRWMMGNIVLQTDSNGNIKIDKKKSGNKIDGVAALVNAIAQWVDFDDGSSIYNIRDMRVI